MSDLAKFLLARIAEDEEAAREAAQWTNGQAEWGDGDPDAGDPDERHIARHDPAHVLAECEAKRGVVVAYLGLREAAKTAARAGSDEEATTGRNMYAGVELALRALAVPYADHADYREEWKP